MSDFYNFDLFSHKIKTSLPINTAYMAYIKLRYFNDSFCMSGKQFAFDYKSIDKIFYLFEVVNSRIANSFEEYNMNSENIVYVQIGFRKLDVKLLTEFALDKS